MPPSQRLCIADPLTLSPSCQAVKSDGQTALHEAAEANTQAQDKVSRAHGASQPDEALLMRPLLS